jgi:hypothetical protein
MDVSALVGYHGVAVFNWKPGQISMLYGATGATGEFVSRTAVCTPLD